MTLPETLYIPRQSDFATVPMPVTEAICGWCKIKLRAISTPPVKWRELWYHPGGCVANARRVDAVTNTPTVELDLATGRRSLGTIESPDRLATPGGGPTAR